MKPCYTGRWFLVALDECGTEVISHPYEGETREDVRARMPEEWHFRGFESERDYSQEAWERGDDDYGYENDDY